jgi:hypothetical protein
MQSEIKAKQKRCECNAEATRGNAEVLWKGSPNQCESKAECNAKVRRKRMRKQCEINAKAKRKQREINANAKSKQRKGRVKTEQNQGDVKRIAKRFQTIAMRPESDYEATCNRLKAIA